MKISFHTLGCKVNYAETAQIQESFEQLGYEVTEFGNTSDVVLINTCSVTNNADVEARKLIRRAKRQSPNAFLGVFGCYAQLKPEEVAKTLGVDAVFGQAEKFKIPQMINNMMGVEKTQINVSCIEDLPFDAALTSDNDSRTRAFFKMQDGCDYPCTYCTIPMARGNSRSLPFNLIPKHFKKIADSGYKEVVISGINLGEYKVNTGENFTDVVKLIDTFDLGLRVRISSIEPNLLTDDILNTVQNSNTFCKHFHIPLQSGSKEILRKMKRRYKKEYYNDLIYKIKSMMPDCGIGVDVIVGFPGETDEHFMETYNFIKSLPVSYLHVFTYSERDNTPAATMEGKIPVEIRKEHTNQLRELSKIKTKEFHLSQIGKIKTVIPESKNESDGTWKGWSENYIRVQFHSDENLANVPTKVKLTGFIGENMIGEVIA